jgi:hypothetical protein
MRRTKNFPWTMLLWVIFWVFIIFCFKIKQNSKRLQSPKQITKIEHSPLLIYSLLPRQTQQLLLMLRIFRTSNKKKEKELIDIPTVCIYDNYISIWWSYTDLYNLNKYKANNFFKKFNFFYLFTLLENNSN